MKYQSSRGKYGAVSAAQAITMGISPDGGLFVPDCIPSISTEILKQMESWTYQQRAAYIMQLFLEEFSPEEIKACVNGAYNEKKFDHPEIAPLIELRPGLHIQELWHGPTCAFKDMALQVLPRLLTTSTNKIGETSEIIILVATSGDTGKAALEGFRDVAGTQIIVFFPQHGVSEVQKMQMITQEGNNVHVAGVLGNFDDAQSGVKNIFTSNQVIEQLQQQGMKMSSANSINWGRLLPQIVYYISAYVDLCQRGYIQVGEAINIVVPTGNFGNILAAYYARRMGIPVKRLICAANSNNVLTDFIMTGVYDRNRSFEKTISPSMDILISSNLERLLYELTGHDSQRVSQWMDELKNTGRYTVNELTRSQVQEIFWSDYAADTETLESITRVWDKYHYLLDTHTAVALNVYDKYLQQTGDNSSTVIASTASPFKFGSSVAQAVLSPEQIEGKNEFELLQALAVYTGMVIPEGIKNLDKRKIQHHTVTSAAEMEEVVFSFLGIE
ncbi:MAG: threonine synthase [Syntrophomonadaceae bacterium]|nr:threonine synthase [Syntrophomonadaceae bacterium]